MATGVQKASDGRHTGADVARVFGEHLLQVIAPQSPGLDERVVHLDSGRKSFVGIVGSADLSQKHSFQCVQFCCHLFGEILEIGRLDHFQTFLKLVLSQYVSSLQTIEFTVQLDTAHNCRVYLSIYQVLTCFKYSTHHS